MQIGQFVSLFLSLFPIWVSVFFSFAGPLLLFPGRFGFWVLLLAAAVWIQVLFFILFPYIYMLISVSVRILGFASSDGFEFGQLLIF